MEYVDSGSRDPAKTLHAWLKASLPGASFFGCQSGYFTADALYEFQAEFVELLTAGGEVRLVLGANEDELSGADLHAALDLLEPYGDNATILIVSAVDLLMHPKTFYIEHPGGECAALVGSANLTGSGLGANIEAGLSVNSTDDPDAPFKEIRAAIEAWREPLHPNAKVLHRDLVPQLAAAAVIDQPRRARALPRRSLRRLFPPMGRLIPIRRRRVARPTRRPQATLVLVPGQPFPDGAIGLVKRLSALDTKGFRGGRGTLYVSLPPALLPLLPTVPFGVNDEPRLNVTIEARHASAPGHVVTSGANPTNITGVGYGPVPKSNKDVRFNILRVIVAGVEYIANNAAAKLPGQGDYLAIELDTSGHAARLTFVVEGDLKSQMASVCGTNTWGWLPDGLLLPW